MRWLSVFILCTLVACSANKQKIYDEKMNEIQLTIGSENYNWAIDSFRDVNGRFPDSLNDVYLAYKHDNPDDIKVLEARHFIDIFSKKKEWVGYYPIYGSGDTTIISYVILSAGIDGKLDNVPDSSNKLHLDDWQQKLKLYAPAEFDGVYSDTYARWGDKAYPYNAADEKSGNKDLLIHVYRLNVYRYGVLIDHFKEEYGRFPSSLNEVYLDYKHKFPGNNWVTEAYYFIDLFSKKKEWVSYFPIYDSDDTTIISYVLLSAGIDGKLDNVLDVSNKLHMNDWQQKLKLYNPDSFDDGINIYSDAYDKQKMYQHRWHLENYPYDAMMEKSGDKDLLVGVHHFVVLEE